MSKSPDAFRTISEVAEWLEKPAHVLRFWESKFPQVKPVKRAGGRRYYRPEDMLLLGGIKKLLHDDGMTIKGAQKIMREQGVRYVSGLSQQLDDVAQAALEETVLMQELPGQPDVGRDAIAPEAVALDVEPEPGNATVLAFPPATEGARPAPETPSAAPTMPKEAIEETALPGPPEVAPLGGETDSDAAQRAGDSAEQPETVPEEAASDSDDPSEDPTEPLRVASGAEPEAAASKGAMQPAAPEASGPPEGPVPPDPASVDAPAPVSPADAAAADAPPTDSPTAPPPAPVPADLSGSPLPSFIRGPAARPPVAQPVLRPRIVEVPPLPDPAETVTGPGALARLLALRPPSTEAERDALLRVRQHLGALRDRLAQPATD